MPREYQAKPETQEKVAKLESDSKETNAKMGETCSTSGSLSSLLDGVSMPSLPDFDFPSFDFPDFGDDDEGEGFSLPDFPDISLPDLGGEGGAGAALKEGIEKATGAISAAMGIASQQTKEWYDDFCKWMQELLDDEEENNTDPSETDKMIAEAEKIADEYMNKTADFFADAKNSISDTMTSIGGAISSAFSSLSASGCEDLSASAAEIPPEQQSQEIKDALANKGKPPSEALKNSVSNSPAMANADALSTQGPAKADAIKNNKPMTKQELFAAIGKA